MKIRKKLIEVALPLEAINKASAREKSIPRCISRCRRKIEKWLQS